MRDVLTHLNAGDVASADKVIAYHFGELKDINGGMKEFEGNEDVQDLPQNPDDFQQYIDDLQRNGSFHNWFFLMGPAQQQLVIENFVVTVLSGVSLVLENMHSYKKGDTPSPRKPGKKGWFVNLK